MYQKLILAAALMLDCSAVAAQLLAGDSVPPGKLVDIGGRHIHLLCSGAGAAGKSTVIMSAGGGDFATDWMPVQRALSDSNRVCSYDRPGYGWSDPGPGARTFEQEAYEIHVALRKADVKAPYVFVGHSLGAFVARRFAEMFPSDVRGLVLVGPTNENGKLGYRGQFILMRTVATDRPIPPVDTSTKAPIAESGAVSRDSCRAQAALAARIVRPYDQLRAQAQRYRLWALGHPACQRSGDDFFAEEMAAFFAQWSKSPHPLGDVPLVVVLGTRSERPPGLPEAEWRSDTLRLDLSRLSSRGRLITDSTSGHHVQLDNPLLVARTIREMANQSHLKGP